MLAMVVNDNAGNLTPRGVLQLIASRLAPTEDGAHVAMPLKKRFYRAESRFLQMQNADKP